MSSALDNSIEIYKLDQTNYNTSKNIISLRDCIFENRCKNNKCNYFHKYKYKIFDYVVSHISKKNYIGRLSSWIYGQYNTYSKFIEINRYESIINIEKLKNKRILFLDVVPTKDDLEFLLINAKKIHIISNHEILEDEKIIDMPRFSNNKLSLQFDKTKITAISTWEYLYKDSLPWFINIANAKKNKTLDKIKDGQLLNYYLSYHAIFKNTKIHTIINKSLDIILLKTLSIQRDQIKNILPEYKDAIMKIDDLIINVKVIKDCKYTINNISIEYILQNTDIQIVVYCTLCKNNWKYELRSLGDINVEEIVKTQGGIGNIYYGHFFIDNINFDEHDILKII